MKYYWHWLQYPWFVLEGWYSGMTWRQAHFAAKFRIKLRIFLSKIGVKLT